MASTADLERLMKEIEAEHSQTPDILISNAGHGQRIPDILDIPLAEFEYTLKVNLTATFILTKLCVPHMSAQHWGRIIYVSSISAYGGGSKSFLRPTFSSVVLDASTLLTLSVVQSTGVTTPRRRVE